MEEKVIMAGYGGQGIMFMANLLAYGAIEENLEVTFFPTYGAEIRGGTANASVIISSYPIGSPVIEKPDTLIAMNQPSLDKFLPRLKENGLLLLNKSLIKNLPSQEYHLIPATEIAQEINDERVANVIMLGFYLKKKGIISLESILKALESIKKNFQLNKQAFLKGWNYANN